MSLWLSRRDVADAYGVQTRSVRNWVLRGHVVERTRNGRREVNAASVQAYLDGRGAGQASNAAQHTRRKETP